MSKGLEALDILKLRLSSQESNKVLCNFIEQELKEYEEIKKDLEQVMSDYQDLGNSVYKQVKALEIIKEKRVNVRCLMSGWSLAKYNSYTKHVSLTQKEYDLLIEVLL